MNRSITSHELKNNRIMFSRADDIKSEVLGIHILVRLCFTKYSLFEHSIGLSYLV